MADTRKAIINDIRTRLLEITTANGFHQTVKNVIKKPQNTVRETPASYPVIWLEVGNESSPFETWETTDEIEASFNITLGLALNPPQNVDHMDAIEDFIRDAKAKLHADPRRSELAQWSVVVGVGDPKFLDEQSLVEVDLTVETQYVTQPTDP